MENENKIQDLVDNSENGFSSWSDGDDYLWINITDRSLNFGFGIDEFKEFAQNIAQTLRRLEHTPDPMMELYKTSKCFRDLAVSRQAQKENSTEDQAYYEGEENAYAVMMIEIEDQRKEV